VFKEHGALSVVECWGDQVPEGKLNSMHSAVLRKDDETVVFSWITWPDKATRDAGMARIMDDPRMSPDVNPMPFDGKRMIFGGFESVVSEQSAKPARNTVCLWFDGDAVEAAQFYARTFPDSAVGAIHRAPADFPSGKQGDVLTVEFSVMGVPCLGLNGGPAFKHSEAFSFQVATDDQAETDRLWNAIIGHGGQASACGWCKDKWGLSWQITPRALIAAITDPDPQAARRAFEAMMDMTKIDIAVIQAARRG
jgi:predicted 3-demethylubiquinone-9 3-methyltransferase (glyoxalase superfamily)/uncharacterized protein YbaA (DUF1428 family)